MIITFNCEQHYYHFSNNFTPLCSLSQIINVDPPISAPGDPVINGGNGAVGGVAADGGIPGNGIIAANNAEVPAAVENVHLHQD